MANLPATEECALPISFSHFPPRLSALASLGFDSISISKKSAVLRKAESTDLYGRPHMFFEIRFNRNKAELCYSVPRECDAQARRLHAALLFLRTLSLIPGAQANLASLCAIVLPSLERAELANSLPYELISKKHSDCESQLFETEFKFRRLAKAFEESTRRFAELERQNAFLRTRISKLEAVPDNALCESILDWLSAHRGTFSASHFSKENSIPPSRCEEGLGILLKSGAIRRANGRYSEESAPEHEHFTIARCGPLHLARRAAGKTSRLFSEWVSHKE